MEIKHFIQPVRRWWWLIVTAMVLGALFSYLAVRNEPQVYQARATLFSGRAIDDPNPSGSDFILSQQLARAYADIGQQTPVRQATMQALGLRRLPQVNVRNPPNTSLVEILVVDTDPVRSQAVANEMANQLIMLSPSAGNEEERSSSQRFIQGQIGDLEEQIRLTEEEIETAEAELAGVFSAQEIADAEAAITALQNKLNSLRQIYASLLASSQEEASNTLTIIEPATVPTAPIGPNILSTILAATGISLAVATAAAFVLEYIDDRIRNPEDVERVLGERPIATIPQITLPEGTSPLITMKQPLSPAADSFRTLNTLLEVTSGRNTHSTVLVTSPGIRDGKSFIASNLSVVMAQSGYRVLLIDGDLLRPTQHLLFELPNEYGLVDILTYFAIMTEMNGSGKPVYDEIVLEQAIQSTDTLGLDVMTSGAVGRMSHDLLTVRRVDWLFEILVDRYNVIIFDGPPILAVSSSSLLSSQVDRSLLVVNAASTRRGELRETMGRLNTVFANTVVMLNRFTPSSADYSYYYQRTYHTQIDRSEQQSNSSRVRKGLRNLLPGRG